jgi:hypothetical protein
MGIAFAWDKMSKALDSLATAPEALPARLKHALFPHFMSALYDAEQVQYLPVELLETMRRVSKRVTSSGENQHGQGIKNADLSDMSQADAETLAKEIVYIAHEIRRLSTF